MTGRPAQAPTIGETARAFRIGELSPVDVVEATLARIAALDPDLHAFATVTAVLARTQAHVAAAEVRDDPGIRRPLLGIPVGVKDIIDVAGVPTCSGVDGPPAMPAAADATVWRRLADAGAVIVGKTRTHELAYGVSTPPTRHPVDPDRMPGGSSGGSAVALAAGMCLGAVGTDTAGSIRIPAGLCGVVGLKPTRDLCPTDGILPLAPTLDHVGPMARTPADAALLLAAMAQDGPDRPVDLAGIRVGLATADALWTPDVRDAFVATADAVASAGAEVAEVASPSFADARWHADRIIGVEAGVVNADLLASAGDRLSASTRAKLATANRIDGPTYDRALRHASQVRAGFEAALSDVDVLLAPGVACTAPVHDAETVAVDGHRRPLGHVLCWNAAAANLAGMPAVALPAGTARDGLPVGVQLIGAAGGDHRLLVIATAVVAAFDGR